MRIAAIAFCLFLACCSAFATISNVAPTSFYVGSVEEYIQLDGSGLSGTDSTDIVFSGPAGTYTVAPNLEADTALTVWVPVAVLVTAGHYSVTVNANDSGGVVRTSGPVFFDVIERPLDGPPLLGLPEIIYAEAAGPTGAIVTFATNATSQGGASLSLTCDHASGALFPLGTTTVHCTATDTFGSAAGSFVVVVGDSKPPVLTLPGDITTSSTTVTWSATATDNIDGAITPDCSPASGSTFAVGTTTVVCTATDERANLARGEFQVTVLAGPPALVLPDDFFVEATSAAGATAGYVVTSIPDSVITCTPASGAIFPLGTTTVQCSGTNVGGTTTGSFKITVRDTTAPALTLPANITAEATGSAGATVSYAATASDLVDGTVTVTCLPTSGSLFPLGPTTVSCSASDSRSNTATASFTVTVVDTTPPLLSLPTGITAEATSASGAVVSFLATANDLVDGAVPVSCSPPSGATFPLGVTTVQCSATDSHLNTRTGSFLITVRDTTAPVIVSVSATPNVLAPPNHLLVPVVVSVAATDAVDPAPASHIVSVTSNQPINGPGDGNTQPDWVITGPLTIQLRAERSGVFGDRIYTLTIETSDFSGNVSTATTQVRVQQAVRRRSAGAP